MKPRDALIRLALFVPLYLAVDYLLSIVLNSVTRGALKNWWEFLAPLPTLIAALLAGGVMISVVDHRKLGALGFGRTSQTVRECFAGFGVGGGGIVVATLLMLAFGSLRFTTEAGTAAGWTGTVLLHLAILAVSAAAEEALFRGYGFQVLVSAFGPVVATVGASAAFAAAHLNNPNVTAFALVNIFLAGLMLSYAYLRTMSLWFATTVHLGWNWTMASLFDLPVSGISSFKTPMYEPVITGTRWLGGGTFGPEGGIVGTIGMLAVLIAIGWVVRMRVAPEMAAMSPLAMNAARDTTRETLDGALT